MALKARMVVVVESERGGLVNSVSLTVTGAGDEFDRHGVAGTCAPSCAPESHALSVSSSSSRVLTRACLLWPQGVADFYTDPQIHSEDGQGFGSGNTGMDVNRTGSFASSTPTSATSSVRYALPALSRAASAMPHTVTPRRRIPLSHTHMPNMRLCRVCARWT